jgi:hypothetical protein
MVVDLNAKRNIVIASKCESRVRGSIHQQRLSLETMVTLVDIDRVNGMIVDAQGEAF